jgi:ABC-2 type transport system permease protein
MRWVVYWSLFVASFKMFVRNRAALFFSLFVPLLIMLIFGVLNFGGSTSVSLGLVDQAQTDGSRALVKALQQTDTFSRRRAGTAQGGASRPGAGDPRRLPAGPSELGCAAVGGVQQPLEA